MKILSTAWNVIHCDNGKYEVYRNGGSIMISDICEYIGRKEKSFLFVGSERMPEMEYGHIHLIDNSTYLPSISALDNIRKWQKGLMEGFRKCLSTINPGFVLVHGNGDFSAGCMDICREKGVAFAFVDHLFQGNREELYDERLKEWEDRLFSQKDTDIIAVGTAMKKRMMETYSDYSESRITVIPNGTPFIRREKIRRNFRKELKAGSKRILLCSGTLHPRKNQMQLVDTYKLLPKEIKENLLIVFCGNDSKKQPQKEIIESKIKQFGMERSLLYIGAVSREDMHDLYAAVDGLIMPSRNEGLSLVALEAMVYGKPVIMFEDNETAGDVNDSCSTILVSGHSNIGLAEGIIEWYDKEWDYEHIKEYISFFNMERVADDYIQYCETHS